VLSGCSSDVLADSTPSGQRVVCFGNRSRPYFGIVAYTTVQDENEALVVNNEFNKKKDKSMTMLLFSRLW
jgi:hypothetical protein